MSIDCRGPLPRMPKRPRRTAHYVDCVAAETQDGRDCNCVERDDAAWDAEGERRYDSWKNGDYTDRGDR